MPLHHPLRQAAVALSLLAAAGAACAQQSPYYVGVSQGLTYRDNLFLQQDGIPLGEGLSRSDLQSVSSLLAGLDQPLGRGRVYARGTLSANRFKNNDQLDSSAYALTAGLDFETIERLSGNVNFNTNRNLRFDSINENNQRIAVRNIETLRELTGVLRLGVVTRLSAELGLGRLEIRYSNPESAFREFEQNTVSLGGRFRPGGSTTFSLGVRQTDNKYPQYFRQLADPSDNSQRRDLDFGVDWQSGGPTSLNARVSYGKTEPERDFRGDTTGLSGALNWIWVPTGKLRFVTSLNRDVGQESALVTTPTNAALRFNDNDTTTTAIRVRSEYAVTAKISATAALGYIDREIENNFSTASIQGNDKTTTASLGARWQPTRALQVGCDVGYERRGNNSRRELSTPYSSSTAGCFGQFLLQ